MGTHGLNLDAVQCGVDALLTTYPDEQALDGMAPTGAPRGAHAVLWIDDWWRGVDMAREALESAQLRWSPRSTGQVRTRLEEERYRRRDAEHLRSHA
jgi:hypothetical protein